VLQLIARKLATKALEGDLDAIKEIFDRMDGKTRRGRIARSTAGKGGHATEKVVRPRRQFVCWPHAVQPAGAGARSQSTTTARLRG
jgi:hypothetical protein